MELGQRHRLQVMLDFARLEYIPKQRHVGLRVELLKGGKIRHGGCVKGHDGVGEKSEKALSL